MRIVITHQNADFDALATMLAARLVYGDVEMIVSSAVSSPVKKYLALHRDWLGLGESLPAGQEVEEVIVVDTRDKRRLTEFSELLEKAKRIVIYDHHPDGDEDLRGDREVIEPVGACVTLLVEELVEKEQGITEREATLLMLGLYADTGGLSFASTTPRDMRAAAYLREQGAYLEIVNRYLQQEFSAGQQKLLVELLGGIEIVERQGLKIGIAISVHEKYIKGGALAVERALPLLGLDACFAVLGQEGKSGAQLIGRSSSRQVDCQVIAARWGGGGHRGAAAARAGELSVEEMAAELRRHLEELSISPLEVRDIMTTPVETVSSETTLREVDCLLQRWNVTGVPVLKDGRVVGVVSRRDVKKGADREDWEIPVAGFMSQHVLAIDPGASLEEAFEKMTSNNIGRLPVLGPGKELLGILSRTDVLKRLYSEASEDLRK